MPLDKRYYWWRAISAAYLIRPNKRTQQYIRSLSTPGLHHLNGSCVSMYIRRGDKGREMKLLSFSSFSDAANLLRNYGNDQKVQRTIFLGTETPQVIEEAEIWQKDHNWKIMYNPLQIEIFNKTDSDRGSHHNRYHPRRQHPSIYRKLRGTVDLMIKRFRNQNISSSSSPSQTRSDYEFLHMIINLADLMKCNAFVCTLMSNYCRLLDEFRAVVAAKPHALFADLSQETCARPPCIGPDHIQSFDW